MSKKQKFNNGDRPLICACIADNDPHRGDSKSTVMLSKLITEMVDGDYLYVDQPLIERLYPNLCIADGYRAFFEENGSPDYFIGTHSYIISSYYTPKKPRLTERRINEAISGKDIDNKTGLVAHHLTDNLLARHACAFLERYPNYSADDETFIAVMLCDDASLDSPHIKKAAQKLVDAALHHENITFFLCPSRRSQDAVNSLETRMKKLIKEKDLSNITLVAEQWEWVKETYNPYLGLLALTDHIVVIGDSRSIISEALFTGRKIYHLKRNVERAKLVESGYIIPLDKNEFGFETEPINVPDITKQAAAELASQFLSTQPEERSTKEKLQYFYNGLAARFRGKSTLSERSPIDPEIMQKEIQKASNAVIGELRI